MDYVEFDLRHFPESVVVVRFHRMPTTEDEVQAYLRRFRTLVHAAAGVLEGAIVSQPRPISLVFSLNQETVGMPSMALIRAQADFISEIRPLVEEHRAIRCTAVIGSAVVDTILRFILAFVRPIAPLRVFASEPEALAWVRSDDVTG